jgi:uncharacterized protein (DUF2249 family)/quercetin dioxygenase-like cupin family protein
MADCALDLRELRQPDKHPTVFQAYAALAVGGTLVLVNDHDPRRLREEFEIEHPGGFAWDYLAAGPGPWRVRITKLASTPLPRVLADTAAVSASVVDVPGAVWKLQARQRDLDSNIIALAPGAAISAHAGPEVDVLIHVLAGSGQLGTELGTIQLRPGALIWLPRRSRRQFTAGPDGLKYLTVHQRRQALTLTAAPAGRD